MIETKFFNYGQKEIRHLKKVDAKFGKAITKLGKIERVVIPDVFTALVHSIVGQLISTKAVDTIWLRMQNLLGEITATNLAKIDANAVQQCGMTMKKACYICGIAKLVESGQLDLESLKNLDDVEVINQLIKLDGIGIWTAEMLMLHCFERSNILSWGDIAIRRGLEKLHDIEKINKQQFDNFKQLYSPYGSVASIYLWRIALKTD